MEPCGAATPDHKLAKNYKQVSTTCSMGKPHDVGECSNTCDAHGYSEQHLHLVVDHINLYDVQPKRMVLRVPNRKPIPLELHNGIPAVNMMFAYSKPPEENHPSPSMTLVLEIWTEDCSEAKGTQFLCLDPNISIAQLMYTAAVANSISIPFILSSECT